MADRASPGGRFATGAVTQPAAMSRVNPVEGRGIVDLKTADELDSFELAARAFGYIHQLAFYRSLVAQVSGHLLPVHIVAVEKREPLKLRRLAGRAGGARTGPPAERGGDARTAALPRDGRLALDMPQRAKPVARFASARTSCDAACQGLVHAVRIAAADRLAVTPGAGPGGVAALLLPLARTRGRDSLHRPRARIHGQQVRRNGGQR